jgi:hypothetical protein
MVFIRRCRAGIEPWCCPAQDCGLGRDLDAAHRVGWRHDLPKSLPRRHDKSTAGLVPCLAQLTAPRPFKLNPYLQLRFRIRKHPIRCLSIFFWRRPPKRHPHHRRNLLTSSISSRRNPPTRLLASCPHVFCRRMAGTLRPILLMPFLKLAVFLPMDHMQCQSSLPRVGTHCLPNETQKPIANTVR